MAMSEQRPRYLIDSSLVQTDRRKWPPETNGIITELMLDLDFYVWKPGDSVSREKMDMLIARLEPYIDRGPTWTPDLDSRLIEKLQRRLNHLRVGLLQDNSIERTTGGRFVKVTDHTERTKAQWAVMAEAMRGSTRDERFKPMMAIFESMEQDELMAFLSESMSLRYGKNRH